MKIVFMGTAAFAGPTLNQLVEAGHEIPMVVTQPDRPAGRGLKLLESPIKRIARERGLSIYQPDRVRDPDALARIEATAPDAIVVVAYGQILPPRSLAVSRFGAINLHASLLPRHRGPAPIAWAILLGDRETGVTIMQMDAGVDTGPILTQERVPIATGETVSQLEETLAEVGAGLMVKTLAGIEGGTVKPRPQPAEGATHARRLASEDGRLSTDMPAVEIDRRVRALTPSPGCWMTISGHAVKVLRGHLGSDNGEGIRLRTEDGVYVVDEVQPPGGRRMSAAAWARGRR